jgi:hypothetical protein
LRHALVRALLVHYAERSGYAGPFRLLTRIETFDRIRRKRGVELAPDEHNDYAMTIKGRYPVVWVNVRRHARLSQLVDTAAHEAIHIADAAIQHGPEFDRKVRRLVRGGRL